MSQQPSYRRYRVKAADKKPLLEILDRGLVAGGAEVLEAPDPGSAPFEYLVRLPGEAESLRLICYAFRANKYRQGGRPGDEHRFQIKYGSDFHEYHDLAIFDDPRTVTLFVGVHREAGIIVACDPAMHDPTWFSKSVEFKDEHVVQTLEQGWYGWERERSEGRRKIDLPMLDYRVEAVVAFTPEHLVRFIKLERATTGADPGERLLLADRAAPGYQPDTTALAEMHPLELELGLVSGDILDMIDERFRLKAAVRGAAAEEHLRAALEQVGGVTGLVQLDEDGRPDFTVTYRQRVKGVTVECKNVLRKSRKNNLPVVDFQKTRASKGDPCSRYYLVDHCDILAACLH
ncbi:MAG TPA: hypothetical protein VKU40_16480, partial [Thermoanaerobaculia bacterium]|nr:hypothetical protein [Thermoanaerobaculia bacterium]